MTNAARRERADTDARRIIKLMWGDYTLMPDKTQGASSQWAFVQVRELQQVLTIALADAERVGMEKAAKVCEAEALIDDERGYYGKEIAKAIRAKGVE